MGLPEVVPSLPARPSQKRPILRLVQMTGPTTLNPSPNPVSKSVSLNRPAASGFSTLLYRR